MVIDQAAVGWDTGRRKRRFLNDALPERAGKISSGTDFWIGISHHQRST